MEIKATRNFNFIKTTKCRNYDKKNVTRKRCKTFLTKFHTGVLEGIEYSAKLNVPLLPKIGCKQVVIGRTKNLLPYFVLKDYFRVFVIKPTKWAMGENLQLIDCLSKKWISNKVIRIVCTPSELVDEHKNYRVTAEEICVLKKAGFRFYKYNNDLFPNIYFCSKSNLNMCQEVKDIKNCKLFI